MVNTLKGRFTPKNPQKYAGNVKNIIFRSSYEMQFMRFMDESKNILKWASEEISIPYFDPITQRKRRYFPDFLIEQKNKDNSVSKILVEIKPKHQIFQPKRTPKKSMETYMTEMMEWTKNRAKWEAAKNWCEDRKITFVVITKNDQNRFSLLTEAQLGL